MQNNIIYMEANHHGYETQVVMMNNTIQIPMSMENLIEKICNHNGTSIAVIRKMARKKLKMFRNVPIFVSQKDELVFFLTHSLKDSRCIAINPKAVLNLKAYGEGKTQIEFINGAMLVINMSSNNVMKQFHRSIILRDFFSQPCLEKLWLRAANMV